MRTAILFVIGAANSSTIALIVSARVPPRVPTMLNAQLEETDRFTRAQEQAVEVPAICVGECVNRR
jgi:hypothetical protein